MSSMIIMWVHVIAVAAWIGGMAFMSLVLKSAVKEAFSSRDGLALLNRVWVRFRTIKWMSFVILIVTGFFNLLRESSTGRLETPWGSILLIKLLLIAVVVGVSAIQDFVLLPNTRPESGEANYRRAWWISNSMLILGLLIVLAAVDMSRF